MSIVYSNVRTGNTGNLSNWQNNQTNEDGNRKNYCMYRFINRIFPRSPLTGRRRLFSIISNRLAEECRKEKYNDITAFTPGVGRVVEDKQLQKIISPVFQKLKQYTQTVVSPKIPYAFKIVDGLEDEVAETNIRGTIFLSKKIFQELVDSSHVKGFDNVTTEDKIAFIIAHEMAHCILNHHTEMISNYTVLLLSNLLLGVCISCYTDLFSMGSDPTLMDQAVQLFTYVGVFFIGALVDQIFIATFSQAQEYEADEYGDRIMVQVGYSSKGALCATAFLQKSEKKSCLPSLLHSHPLTANRIKALEKTKDE